MLVLMSVIEDLVVRRGGAFGRGLGVMVELALGDLCNRYFVLEHVPAVILFLGPLKIAHIEVLLVGWGVEGIGRGGRRKRDILRVILFVEDGRRIDATGSNCGGECDARGGMRVTGATGGDILNRGGSARLANAVSAGAALSTAHTFDEASEGSGRVGLCHGGCNREVYRLGRRAVFSH